MNTELRLRREGVDWREVQGQVVALAPDGRELVVNRTGSLLWPLLVEGSTRARLREQLMSSFGIDSARADEDLEAFIAALRERGLLEG